jgi:hypothetical protein
LDRLTDIYEGSSFAAFLWESGRLSLLRISSVAIAVAMLAGCASAGSNVGVPVASQQSFVGAKFRKLHARAHPAASFMNPLATSTWSNIYVANNTGSTDSIVVLKFDPTGSAAPSPIRTITAGISNPRVLAFDTSGNLYVANGGNNTVTEYESGANATCGKITGVMNPQTMTVQNGELWVGTSGDASLTEYNPPCTGLADAGSAVAQFTRVYIVNPQAVAFQGNGYVTVADSASVTVSAYNMSTGARGRVITNGIDNPQALLYDNRGSTDPLNDSLWVANFDGNTVTLYPPATVAPSLTMPLHRDSLGYTIKGPTSLALEDDGAFVWVANHNGGNVDRIDANSGIIDTTYTGIVNGGPSAPQFTNIDAVVTLPYPGNPSYDYVVVAGPGYVTAFNSAFGAPAGPNDDGIRCLMNPCSAHAFSPFTAGIGTGLSLAVGP